MDDILQRELKRRLDAYDKMLMFVNDLADWNATCDSYYDLFTRYQQEAKQLRYDISVKQEG